MKRKPFLFIFLFFLMLFFGGWQNVWAAEEEMEDPADIYAQQYEASGASDLSDALPEETREWLAQWGLDASDPTSAGELSFGNALDMIREFLVSGGKKPLTAAAAATAVILLCALFSGAGSGLSGQEMQGAFSYISTLAVAGVILLPMMSAAAGAISAIKAASVFMLSFVPVFAAILISAGKPLTAAGFQPLVLGAAQVVGQAAAFFLTPLTGMYMAVSMSAALAPSLKTGGFSEGIRKTASWILTLSMTLFTGLLGIQTAIQGSADGLAMKTTKFLTGTFVPVVGASVSEALSTVQGCLGILKTTVGVYAVAAVAALLLPILLELLIWRLVLSLLTALSDLFDLQAISGLLKAAGGAAALLTAICLCVGLTFIISAAVVSIAAG